jgi:hypothetical protein
MVSAARSLVLALFVLLAAQIAAPRPAGAVPPPGDSAGVRAGVESVYDWAGYQRDLPDETPEPQRWSTVNIGFGQLGDTLLYGLLVIAIVAVALWLRRAGWDPLSARSRPVTEEAAAVVSTNASRDRLSAADRSAFSGDWAGAIHILLLTSIELLRRRRGHDVPPAMTARELVDYATLTEQAKADFAALVGAAELCHFGGRAATRSLYDRCRAHYERLWGVEQPA